MAHPYFFPNPNDRSANSPSEIVPGAKVIDLYNRNNGDKMQNVTAKVQDWFIKTAKEKYNWDNAKFSGNQCILEVDLPKRNYPGD